MSNLSSFHPTARPAAMIRAIREVCGCAILSAAMLAWAPANPAAAQEPPIAEEVQIAPCDGRCPYTLAVEVVAEVGHDEGPGVVDGLGNAFMDASGRVYVAGQDRVQVFATDGTLISAFGRRGEGPGELSGSGGAFTFVEDGVFVVTDIGRRVIMRFDWEGTLLDEVRMSELMDGGRLIPWGGTLAVHDSNILTSAERIGYPLHLVDLATGEIQASFGSLTGEYDWERERIQQVRPARGPDGTVWMAREHAYWIELWSPDNKLHSSMRRDLDWFPDALDDLDGHPLPTDQPEPQIMGLSADDSLMWVMVFRAGEDWEEVHPDNFLERYDTHVEVIDWRRGQVIASRRFNELFLGWTGPEGLSSEIVITGRASVRNRVVRIKLSTW